MSPSPLPVGEPVEQPDPSPVPEKTALDGRFVTLIPLDPDADAQELFDCSHGDEDTESLWTYMGYGPFRDRDAMQAWLRDNAELDDPLFLTVHQKSPQRRVGMVSIMSIIPEMGRLEVGHIWYTPQVQRTSVNTESVYLMLSEAFERLPYRRVEWKCDALNERSRAAARRLGFAFEGIFRQHLVVKGRNRDTAWFSILDGEWPTIRKNMETWLYGGDNSNASLRQLNAELPATRSQVIIR